MGAWYRVRQWDEKQPECVREWAKQPAIVYVNGSICVRQWGCRVHEWGSMVYVNGSECVPGNTACTRQLCQEGFCQYTISIIFAPKSSQFIP